MIRHRISLHGHQSTRIVSGLIYYQEPDTLSKMPAGLPPLSVPRAGEGKRGKSGHLAYLLRQAAGAVRLRMERAFADLQITTAQFVVMTMLDAYPHGSGADLARLALLTPQTVHGITSNLLRAGLINRAPSTVHGRIQSLALTRAGRKLLAECKARVAFLEQGLTADLTGQEEEMIRKWLVRLTLPDVK